MKQCNYSIIPKAKGSIVCSSCGKTIENLPYYPQIIHLFICIDVDGLERRYVGLGLGVPMCNDCCEDTLSRIERLESTSTYIIIGLWVLAMGICWLVSETYNGDARVLTFPIMAALVFYTIYHFKNSDQSINDFIEDKGKKIINPALRYLINNGWRQDMSKALCLRHYSRESLKAELDKICETWDFCLLNNNTGEIVNYHDSATLETVFNESIWVEDIDYDAD